MKFAAWTSFAAPFLVVSVEAQAPLWVKLSPLETTPPSPQLGYEGACAWDGVHDVLIRYGGHNQGGGGEQGSEVWTFEPRSARWTLKEPDISPPGVCCAQQIVFDPILGRTLRFPSFSGSHGWQWWREIYLNDASVWSYDLGENAWRNHRPLPAPNPRPLRAASWDSHHEVVVIFGGETSRDGTLVYDPYANAWARMDPSPQPEFRSGGNLCYDEARRVHVLFGTQFGEDAHTWTYDLARNAWEDRKPDRMPPTRENDAVLAYDSHRKVVVAIVKITTGEEEAARHRLETWLYDAGANRWTRLEPAREPDPSGSRARVLVEAPELGAVLLENRPHPPRGPHEQQIWALRFGDPAALPALLPPAGLRVTTRASGAAELAWEPSPSADVVRYEVHRGLGERPWEVSFEKVAEVAADRRAWTDQGLDRGSNHHYFLRAIGPDGARSEESRRARTQPRVVEDVVVSVLGERRVEVGWRPSPERDVTGYVVERAPVSVLTEDQLVRLKSRTPPLEEPSVGAIERVGAFSPVFAKPVEGASAIDASVDFVGAREELEGPFTYERRYHEEEVDPAGRPYRFRVYAYRVLATNALGVLSGPSSAVLSIPSPPRNLFSREDGATCRLRWEASREKGIRGYRVYRLDGRWDKDSLTRLTPSPVRATESSDPDAGSHTRRYHVIAVDALGQEGFPSSPVWFEREWKRYYAPFTGEWHQ